FSHISLTARRFLPFPKNPLRFHKVGAGSEIAAHGDLSPIFTPTSTSHTNAADSPKQIGLIIPPNQAADYNPYPTPIHRQSPGRIPPTNQFTLTPTFFPLCRLDHQAAFHTRNNSAGESIPICRLFLATVPTKLADLESLVVFSKSSF
ncbi:hypothetical protein LINPERHAP1_LOCUS7770, partial [Linum perenne]